MNINPKYLSGSKNPGRRAQLIRQIADIYKKGKPYPSNLNALMKERDKLQAGGNPYAMPTSAATSGYTSTMSGMAGAHQAAMQLTQLQQEVMDTQQRRTQAEKEREAQEQQQFQQGMQQGAADLGQDLGQEAIKKAANAARMAKIAKGTASAKQVAKASKDTGELLTNLGNYGKGASDAAGAASAAGSSIGAGPIAAAAALAGKGVERLSDDDDDTRTNFGEGAGRLVSGAGTGVGMAAMLGLGPIGLVGAGLVGGYMALRNQRKQKLAARQEEARQQVQDAQIAASEDAAFKQSMLSTGQDMGYNVGNSMTNSYLPGYQMQAGGTITPDDPKIQAATSITRYLDRVDPNRLGMSLKYDNTLEGALLGAGKFGTVGLRHAKGIANTLMTGKKMPNRFSVSNNPIDPKVTEKLVRDYAGRVKFQAGGQYDPATEAYLNRVDPNRLGMGIKPDYTPETMMLGTGTAARGLLNMTAPKILNPAFRGAMPGRTRALTRQLEPKVVTDMGVSLGTIAPSITSEKENKQAGGYMKPLAGGAVEFVGPKHSQGGIMLDPQTEVEGGETMDKVKMKENGGKPADYIFSDYLKLGGKTFAARHKEMLAGGAKQKQIQELAKLQEQVAKREGRDENGPRGPERIMKAGGVKKHQSGDEITGVIPSPDALDQYELDPEGAYARDFPEGQSRTEEGLYRRADGDEVTMAEVENLKVNNPWYDWEDFDPTDPEDVKAFQEAYNEKAPEGARIKVDGKVGEQTVSAYIPYRKGEEETPEEPPTDTPTEDTPPEDTPVVDLPGESRNILLPYQLIGPMAELNTKYPQPNKIAAPVTGRIKLPRVNFNAERAALAGSTNAANKFIQNNAAGPGAIAAQMATIDKQRQGNIDIATQEARQNKQLAAQEELSNLQASQFDASQVARSRQFNAASQNQRDQNEYEKRMLAFNQLGTNLAQFSNDVRAYRSEDRAARAYQIDNEYDRQVSFENAKRQARRKKSPYYGMTDMQIREEIARAYEQGAPTWNMQNQRRANAVIQATGTTPETNEETTTQKRGGYVRKLGGVRRRRR